MDRKRSMESSGGAAVEKNKTYEVKIGGLTHEAQGVARIEGLAVFADGVLPDEKAEIKIIKVNKNYCVGKLIQILEASPKRAEPFCSVYSRCGGCSLQHMTYEAQLDFKENVVREALKRLGGLDDKIVKPAIGMEKPFRYRNKAQFPVGWSVTGEAVTGFYARRSHEVIDSGCCEIQDEAADRIRKQISGFINDKNISVYDEASGKGLVRHVMIRSAFRTGELMVVIVVNGSELPYSDELVRLITGESAREEGSVINGRSAVKSVILNINKKNTNVVLGDKDICLFGRDYIEEMIGDLSFRISSQSFFQVNPIQTEVLYGKAIEFAALTGKETVIDLYCGIGTISLFLAKKAAKVYGIEVVAQAVGDARENAARNRVANTEFLAGSVEKLLPELGKRGVKVDVVVLDPPRKGCDETVLKTIAEMQPERIVYVSCNPATLARDLKYLGENGYKATEAQPVDMFPWTVHVETVVLMSRVDK